MLLTAQGFSHFMVFSDMHDLVDHTQVEIVNQVSSRETTFEKTKK